MMPAGYARRLMRWLNGSAGGVDGSGVPCSYSAGNQLAMKTPWITRYVEAQGSETLSSFFTVDRWFFESNLFDFSSSH